MVHNRSDNSEPEWIESIRKLCEDIKVEQRKDIVIKNGKDCLYAIFFRRLVRIKETYKKEIIPFPVVFEKICLLFSITKKECWDALFTLRDAGWIEIVPYHGIRISKNADQ